MLGLRVILAAGGTGGHLWPALSLARALREKEPCAEFLFIGTGRPIEEKMIDPEGFKRRAIKTSGLKGQGLIGGLKALSSCFISFFEARSIIKEFKPDLCFGSGGYVSVPVGLAARSAGIPLIIHEQNSRPGLSNKVLGRLAARVMLGFGDAASAFPAGKSIFTGNPVRGEIAALSGRAKALHQPLTLLVTGGSQGASGLNKLVGPALVKLKQSGVDFQVFHQAGARDVEWLKSLYGEAELKAEASDFYQDMASYYSRSDLIIARAGALTLAELAAAGLPSVLVPLPTAADDHQSVNARRMEEGGAAQVMAERNTSPGELAGALAHLLTNPPLLTRMGQAAEALARPGADEEMARICLETISNKV